MGLCKLCWLELFKASQVDPREHSQLPIAHLGKVDTAHALAFVGKSLLELWNNLSAFGTLNKVDQGAQISHLLMLNSAVDKVIE